MDDDFASWWASRFGDTVPIGSRMRTVFCDRWVRFHSLPDSKRYAESATERAEVLRRYRALANAVLSASATPWVVAPVYEWDGDTVVTIRELGDERLQYALSFSGDRRGDDREGAIYVARLAPSIESLDAIANDQLRAVWVCESHEEIFAPYDGGTDLILRSRQRVEELRHEFADWLSDRSDML